MVHRKHRIYLGLETRIGSKSRERIRELIDELRSVDFWLAPNLSLVVMAIGSPAPIERGLAASYLGRFDSDCSLDVVVSELTHAIETICPPVIIPLADRVAAPEDDSARRRQDCGREYTSDMLSPQPQWGETLSTPSDAEDACRVTQSVLQ